MLPDMEEIGFSSQSARCRGLLLPPVNGKRDGGGRAPCVILAHGFGGTLDAGLLPYARRFAELGCSALLFDYRHFGLSDGAPRQLISIRKQLQDWEAAIAFARSREGIDAGRIVLWGSSFSGGHVVAVAAADGRVAGVVSQCPMMDGFQAMMQLLRYAGIGHLLRLSLKGAQDMIHAAIGRAPVMLPIIGPPGTLAAMSTPDAEPGYRAIAPPGWRNEACARIALGFGAYRPGRQAPHLPCPILIQICEHDAVAAPAAAAGAARLAGDRATVLRYPIGHFDIYTGGDFERSVGDQCRFLETIFE